MRKRESSHFQSPCRNCRRRQAFHLIRSIPMWSLTSDHTHCFLKLGIIKSAKVACLVTYNRGLRMLRESRAFQLWNTLLLSHIWSHTQLGYFSCATISTQIDTQFGTAILIVAECYLTLYRALVLAVHQLLVYRRLFRRRTESTLNRRLLDREPAVRVSMGPDGGSY